MEPPDQSFADDFNVLQEYAILVFGVRRDEIPLSFQIHRIKMLVKAGLVTFLNACFVVADEVPEEAQLGSLRNLPKLFQAIFLFFRRLML